MEIEELLKPVSEDKPCGLDLDSEYDPEYLALAKDIEGEPEREMGKTKVPAKEPNWNDIKSRARTLFLRSKDLNAAIWFTRACARSDGIGGLLSGLRLIQGCLTQYWECCYPCLDAENNNDPEARLNILSQIGSYEIIVRDVQSIKLTFKHIKLPIRDLLVIQGKLSVQSNQPEYTQAQIEEIFHDKENASFILSLHKQLGEVFEILKNIQKFLSQKLGESYSGSLLNFEKLESVLIIMQRLCGDAILSNDEKGANGALSDPGNGIISSISNNSAASGEIRSREDVVRSLEKVCKYIERTEPTNPASLIIRFAQSLMTKNFVEIMEMLPPEDLKIFKKVLDSKSKK